METEIWKSHPEIDKIEVSSFGRVRSANGHYYKSFLSNKGYLLVGFRVNGKVVSKSVHRLVAQTFIKNTNNLPMVNHLDCDRTNNNVSNLEWCTASYNMAYREKYGESQGHQVFAVNLTTLEVSQFRSQSEAGRELGVKQQNINAVLKGTQKAAHGYWFVNADENAVDIVKKNLHDIGKTGLKLNA